MDFSTEIPQPKRVLCNYKLFSRDYYVDENSKNKIIYFLSALLCLVVGSFVVLGSIWFAISFTKNDLKTSEKIKTIAFFSVIGVCMIIPSALYIQKNNNIFKVVNTFINNRNNCDMP